MTNKRKPAPKAKPKTKKGPMKKNMGGKVMAYKAGGMPEKRKAMARGAAVGATEGAGLGVACKDHIGLCTAGESVLRAPSLQCCCV